MFSGIYLTSPSGKGDNTSNIIWPLLVFRSKHVLTWRVLHMDHKVVVGRAPLCQAQLCLAGIQEGGAVVEVQALRAARLARRQGCEVGFVWALIGRRGGAELHLRGVSCEPDLHVLQLGQTPALQLADQRRLLGGHTRSHRTRNVS